jgi:hypothetical protein
MRGDEAPVPLAERPWVKEILAEPDPAERLALVARNARSVRERTAAVTEIVRQAAPADADIGALWDRYQREFHELGMRPIAEALERDGALRADVETATDVLWTLVHPDVYQLLVRRRGWSPDRYQAWLAGALRDQLLR